MNASDAHKGYGLKILILSLFGYAGNAFSQLPLPQGPADEFGLIRADLPTSNPKPIYCAESEIAQVGYEVLCKHPMPAPFIDKLKSKLANMQTSSESRDKEIEDALRLMILKQDAALSQLKKRIEILELKLNNTTK